MTPCGFCNAADTVPFVRNIVDYITGTAFSIARCAKCGVAFTTPQPERMERYYPPHYRRFGWIGSSVLQFLYHRKAHAWVRTLGAPGTALEIGSGAGWMLRALHRCGWKVIGNERQVEDSLAALAKEGLPLFVGGLDAIGPKARFDLIILFQVLEHLGRPMEVLRHCARLLKPGGTLVVAVPNLASWQARVCGPYWFHLDVPRHLFHFTPASLSHALEAVGFTVTSIGYRSPEHDPYGWIQSTLNWIGFRQNQLTRMLMGMDPWGASWPATLGQLVTSGFLLLPSVAVAGLSWLARAGALMEILAVKPEAPRKSEGRLRSLLTR